MEKLSTTGLSDSGYTINSTYATGGAFSLDGIHPSPRGYAAIANEFLKAINLRYGSNFKGVKFSDYRIMFPPVLFDYLQNFIYLGILKTTKFIILI